MRPLAQPSSDEWVCFALQRYDVGLVFGYHAEPTLISLAAFASLVKLHSGRVERVLQRFFKHSSSRTGVVAFTLPRKAAIGRSKLTPHDAWPRSAQ